MYKKTLYGIENYKIQKLYKVSETPNNDGFKKGPLDDLYFKVAMMW